MSGWVSEKGEMIKCKEMQNSQYRDKDRYKICTVRHANPSTPREDLAFTDHFRSLVDNKPIRAIDSPLTLELSSPW